MRDRLFSYTETSARSRRAAFWGTVALITVAGSWLRFDGLAERELWFDESCTFYAAHHLLDWPADGPDLRKEVAHTPYFLLLHFWAHLVGETAWGLRSFSALIGCLAIPVLAGIATRLAGKGAGLVTAVLVAVHPLHIYYSQEARVYAFWGLETALGLYALYVAARTLRGRWWIAYGVLSWVTVLTHYYTLLWLPGTVTAMVVASDRRRFLRQWLTTHVALGVTLLPVVWLLIVPFGEGGPRPWLRETWIGYPPVLAIPKSLWALLPSGGYPGYLGTAAVASEVSAGLFGTFAGHVARWGPAVIVVILIGVLATSSWPRSAGSHHGAWGEAGGRWGTPAITRSPRLSLLLFLSLLTLSFLGLAFCYSWLVTPSYVVGRYDFAAWPAVTLAIALLIDLAARRFSAVRAGRTAGRAFATAALAICGVVTILGARSAPIFNDVTERARRIAEIVQNDDLVISLGMYRWFMTREWHRLGFTPQVISFPSRHDRQLCWSNPEAELADHQAVAEDLTEITAVTKRALASGKRVWLLAHGEPVGPEWELNRRLFAHLDALRIDVRLEDEWVGLAALVPRGSGAAGLPTGG